MATSPAAAAPPSSAGAGRLWRRAPLECGAASRARVRAANMSTLPNSADLSVPRCRSAARARQAPLCQCCRISDLLSMTPYARCGAGTSAAARPGEADVSIAPIARAPSSPPNQNLRTTIPLKRNGDVGQQPQRRPGGSSRSVCLRARWNRRRLARAREGSQDGERCQIPLIFQCRGRRSAARARASASSVSAAEFPIVVDDPYLASSIGAGTSAAAPSRRSRRQHRSPELHRRPRTGICQQQFR